jgi:hypothetical protein
VKVQHTNLGVLCLLIYTQPFPLWKLQDIHLVSSVFSEGSEYFYFHFTIRESGLEEDE